MKIKITPIKSDTLCDKCKFGAENDCYTADCSNCPMNIPNSAPRCKCGFIEGGKPCPYFVRYEGVGGAADEQ